MMASVSRTGMRFPGLPRGVPNGKSSIEGLATANQGVLRTAMCVISDSRFALVMLTIDDSHKFLLGYRECQDDYDDIRSRYGERQETAATGPAAGTN